MTNAERIKQMSDKDLAIFIMCPAEYDVAFTKSCGCDGEMNKNCYQRQTLKQDQKAVSGWSGRIPQNRWRSRHNGK